MADQGDRGARGLLLIVLGISALTLIGLIIFGVVVFSRLGTLADTTKQAKVIEEKAAPGKIYNLGVFTVNLADEEASRYVRAEVQLEYSTGNPELDKEIKLRDAQFKDMVNSLLNDRKAAELSTSEGKEQFRRELQLKINEALKFGAVTNVYLTQFAVQ